MTSDGRGLPPGQDAGILSAVAVAASADGLDGFTFRPHNCFACGELNVSGLHLQLHLEPARCWTELSLPRRFEGWEGIIHGGILTTILDEVMAWSLVERDTWGVTARLSVDFRRPVAVDQPIRAEGWITEARRRVQRTAGRIVDAADGRELVAAEATYVAAPEARKSELKARYRFVPEPELDDRGDGRRAGASGLENGDD